MLLLALLLLNSSHPLLHHRRESMAVMPHLRQPHRLLPRWTCLMPLASLAAHTVHPSTLPTLQPRLYWVHPIMHRAVYPARPLTVRI